MRSVCAEKRKRKGRKAIVTGLLGTALIVAGSRSNSCAGCRTAATALAQSSLHKPFRRSSCRRQRGRPKAPPDRAGRTRQSLASEVSPVVLEVEGEVVELTGSAEEKFRKWRHIMKKLHDRKSGR